MVVVVEVASAAAAALLLIAVVDVGVAVVALTVRLDGRRKPENSLSCSGNTLFDSFSCSLDRFRLVGTSVILISFVGRLLISPF